MQYLSVVLPLAALVSGVLSNPVAPACSSDSCLAAVTGSGALGDGGLRGSHCASFLATTVTPPAITVTDTITGVESSGLWKRAIVTVCPNEVPNYASACNEEAYSSACACFGFTDVKTTTVAPTTTTKTVYVAPTGDCSGATATVTATSVLVSGSTCPAASTVTSTYTASGSGHGTYSLSTTTVTVYSATATATTVTVTKNSCTYSASTTTTTAAASSTTCNVNGPLATQLVNNFINLLEFTSYPGNAAKGIPAGSGYNITVSDATLSSTDFADISDSINFMAGYPLGSITFPSKAAFDVGQGQYQPEVSVSTLNIWYDCSSITWRWRLMANPHAYPVTGINYMLVGSDGLIHRNYAEFDNGAWLQSFGQSCAINNVTVSTSAPATKARRDLDLE